jgi:hypothetical protein
LLSKGDLAAMRRTREEAGVLFLGGAGGGEAEEGQLVKARRLNKPILLSIGYAAYHWCHVMAHESFEDAGVAAVMNDLFVNIKVDREERPDVGSIWRLFTRSITWAVGRRPCS